MRATIPMRDAVSIDTIQPREDVAGDGGDDQEDRRAGNREPRADLARGHGHEQPAGHYQDDGGEVDDLGHGRG